MADHDVQRNVKTVTTMQETVVKIPVALNDSIKVIVKHNNTTVENINDNNISGDLETGMRWVATVRYIVSQEPDPNYTPPQG